MRLLGRNLHKCIRVLAHSKAAHLFSIPLALLLLGASFPVDDGGRFAPWCTYLDDSVTPNVSVVCSTSRPLPSTPGASIATDPVGFGRVFFFALQGLSGGAVGPAPAITLFTDQVNVAGLRQGAGGSGLFAYSSNDGGRTWGPGVATLFPAAGGANNPQTWVRTTSTTPRYVISVSGNVGGTVAHSLNVGSGWAFSNYPTANNFAGLGVQGAAVLAVGANAADTLTQACLSTNDGQSFSCVTSDAGAGTAPNGASNPVVASPGVNIWLYTTRAGAIRRSIDNGSTWVQVQAAIGSQGPIICLSSTRCVAVFATTVLQSNDAGATWASTATLPGTQAAFTLCQYTAAVFDVLVVSPWPDATTTTTIPAYRTVDGGTSFVGSPAINGLGNNPMAIAGPCTTNGLGGRTSFVVFNSVSGFNQVYYGPVFTNQLQIVGSNGTPVNVDPNGNLAVSQGPRSATTPNPWQTSPVQGLVLFNSDTTGAANTAITVTITAVTGQRVHLRRLEASCAGAGTGTLTVLDGATQRWGSLAAEVVAAMFRPAPWPTSLDSTTGNAMVITLTACGVGSAGRLIVQADQF